jgi:glycosyltransferase involved in cell wall biosynthesis
VRLAVYTDYTYHRSGTAVYAERAFAIFLARLRPGLERLVVLGRFSPPGGNARYPLGDVDFVELPFYPRLSQPVRAAPALLHSVRPFWHSLRDVDCVWVLGPHLLAITFALLAAVRGKRVVLGVRQNLPAYVRSRHPSSRALQAMAWALEGAFRVLARVFPAIVVGPDLAERYRRSRRLLEISVSLVSEAEIASAAEAPARDYGGELRVLSVGRIDAEKNPLMLADVLAELNRAEPRWRLVVCGEGDLEDALLARLAELGQSDRAVLLGYVAFGEELRRRYLESHMLLHSSWTEGLPQVLLEAFAARLPVVASDVGGIRAAAGGVVSLVPPGDADAAARALRAIAGDPDLRERRGRAALDYVSGRTSEAEGRRVIDFLKDPDA